MNNKNNKKKKLIVLQKHSLINRNFQSLMESKRVLILLIKYELLDIIVEQSIKKIIPKILKRKMIKRVPKQIMNQIDKEKDSKKIQNWGKDFILLYIMPIQFPKILSLYAKPYLDFKSY